MRERNRLDASINACTEMEQDLADNLELLELGEAEEDADLIGEAESAIEGLAPKARKMELESLLSGEADGNDTYLEIHAGAGGTESQDWANMLLRMYSRWAERRGYKTEVIQVSAGKRRASRVRP